MAKSVKLISAAEPVASISAATLASVLDQSMDCVKLVSLDGRLTYMNYNGQCAMEIDDFHAVEGAKWTDLWPAEAHGQIESSLAHAKTKGVARFVAFCPTAKGMPRWWHVTVSPVLNDSGQHTSYLSISRDVTDAEMGRQAAEIATAEMRHRLKNSYTMIASLMRNFARGNSERESFAFEMTDRMIALGTAQTLFADKEAAPCTLSVLIPALVEPFDGPACPISAEAIGELVVDQRQADALALVIGELAVNSAKHGAIHNGGTIGIVAAERDGLLTVTWSEQSKAPVHARAREGGQGLALMHRIIAARGGTIVIAWADDGVEVTVTFRVG